ncbi:hypothetical protein Q8I65_16930 [Paenibacillus ottowii]|nr:hypothetical protein [Paenibacillus ottowii]MDP1511880.1 hypothetical protein [Paenibacillus ottowii]
MKSIGIVRQVDELGRIVILRLKSGCLFCGSIEALSYFMGH